MLIDRKILRKIENYSRKSIPDKLKQFLLCKYSFEPFPYECSEDDLFSNIMRDVNLYDSGKLDISNKGKKGLMKEEIIHLQRLYFEKIVELQELQEYVADLENTLSNHNLTSPSMISNKMSLLDI